MKIGQFFVGMSAVLMSGVLVAGDIANVNIRSTVSTRSTAALIDGALFINLPMGVTHDSPSCGVGSNYRYVIKGIDKVMISQALMAFASGKLVDITGAGNCDAWADTESVRYLTVRN